MAEEAKSIPWLKVFIDVGLSGVWGKVTSRVEIGTKYQYRCEETSGAQMTNVTSAPLDGNSE